MLERVEAQQTNNMTKLLLRAHAHHHHVLKSGPVLAALDLVKRHQRAGTKKKQATALPVATRFALAALVKSAAPKAQGGFPLALCLAAVERVMLHVIVVVFCWF